MKKGLVIVFGAHRYGARWNIQITFATDTSQSENELGTTYYVNKQQVNIYSRVFSTVRSLLSLLQTSRFIRCHTPYGVDLHYFLYMLVCHVIWYEANVCEVNGSGMG